MSLLISVISRCPQGLILAPLFLSVYTASIISGSILYKVQAYADDTHVYIHFKSDGAADATNSNTSLNYIIYISIHQNFILCFLKTKQF